MVRFLPTLHHLLTKHIPSPSAEDNQSNAFYENVIIGVQRLTESLPTNFLTFDWILQAVEFLRSMHAGFLHLVDRSSPRCQEWINEYMNESVKLMDVCNMLNRGIGRLGHFAMVVEVAVRAFQSGAIASKAQYNRIMQCVADCRDMVAKLDRENGRIIEEMSGTLGFCQTKLSDRSSLNGAMLVMRHTSASFSRILLSGLVHASAFVSETIPSSSVLSICLSHLEIKKVVSRRISQRTECFIFLHEFEQLQIPLRIVSFEMQSMQGKVRSKSNEVRIKAESQRLNQSCEQFKNGLEVVGLRVNDLFYEIIEGRKKLLNNLSQSTS